MRRFAVVVAATVALALAGCSGSTGGSGADSAAQKAEYEQQLNRGFDMLREQRYADAKGLFAEMAQKYPEDGTVALALGVSHHELGEWDAAETQYKKAVQYGKGTGVKETIENGESKQASTTIDQLGSENLEKLSQDRPK